MLLNHDIWALGPASTRFDHAGGPGIEHLLALAHHALVGTELRVSLREVPAAWPTALALAGRAVVAVSRVGGVLLGVRAGAALAAGRVVRARRPEMAVLKTIVALKVFL